MFPGEKDPIGGNYSTGCESWKPLTISNLRPFHVGRLRVEAVVGSGQSFLLFLVCSLLYLHFFAYCIDLKRGLLPDKKATREDLLERVRANMRPPPRT